MISVDVLSVVKPRMEIGAGFVAMATSLAVLSDAKLLELYVWLKVLQR
jgi:hypothetical protein